MLIFSICGRLVIMHYWCTRSLCMHIGTETSWKVNFDLANVDLSVVDEEYLNNPKVNDGTQGVRILHAWQRLTKVITDVRRMNTSTLLCNVLLVSA